MIIAEFVERNAQDAQALFDRVKKRNPERALKLLIEMQDFVLPRLQRTELAVTPPVFNGAPLTVSDPAEAADAYRRIIGGDLAPEAVRFEPAPPQPALEAPSRGAE